MFFVSSCNKKTEETFSQTLTVNNKALQIVKEQNKKKYSNFSETVWYNCEQAFKLLLAFHTKEFRVWQLSEVIFIVCVF